MSDCELLLPGDDELIGVRILQIRIDGEAGVVGHELQVERDCRHASVEAREHVSRRDRRRRVVELARDDAAVIAAVVRFEQRRAALSRA